MHRPHRRTHCKSPGVWATIKVGNQSDRVRVWHAESRSAIVCCCCGPAASSRSRQQAVSSTYAYPCGRQHNSTGSFGSKTVGRTARWCLSNELKRKTTHPQRRKLRESYPKVAAGSSKGNRGLHGNVRVQEGKGQRGQQSVQSSVQVPPTQYDGVRRESTQARDARTALHTRVSRHSPVQTGSTCAVPCQSRTLWVCCAGVYECVHAHAE